MSTTNNTTVNASRTITPIDGTNGRFEWYQYNEDLRIIHDRETDMFNMNSIAKALNIKTVHIARWLTNKETIRYMTGFTNLTKFGEVQDLTMEIPQTGSIKTVRGKYLHRLLINRFASDICPEYAYKIALLLDDHFELQRTVEENRALEDKNKSLIQKVDELISVNRKMCGQLETIKVTLSTLVENVSELKNHVTSNKLCRYIIVLYTDEERSDDKFIVIKPFCGLRENRPKIDKSTILFEREVSCSIDSFKEALSALEERYIVKIHYRSMTIRRSNIEAFIDEFRVELRRRSTTITDVCDRLDTINNSISAVDSKVDSIDERLKNYEKFMTKYGVDQSFVKRVLDGEISCINYGKVYQLQLSTKNQQPYIDMNGNRLYMPLNVFRRKFL